MSARASRATPRAQAVHSAGTPVVWIASFLALAALTWHVCEFARYAVQALPYRYEIDYGEGVVWQQALLIPGPRMYGDIAEHTFVFHYPPFFHLVARAINAAGVDMLTGGRLISFVSALASALLIAAVTYRAAMDAAGRRAALVGGALGGLLFLACEPTILWAVVMRVDMLAIALSLLGTWCAIRAADRPWLLWAAGLSFVAALYTKQTALAAPVAAFSVAAMVTPRHAARVAAVSLALAAAMLAVLVVATHGGFLRHTVLYNINRYSAAGFRNAFYVICLHRYLVAVAAAGLLWAWSTTAASLRITRPSQIRSALTRSVAARTLAVLTIYLACTTGMLATLGKSGGATNYLLEWMGVLSALAGVAAALALSGGHRPEQPGADSRSTGVIPLLALLPSTLILMQAVALPARYSLPGPGSAKYAALTQLEKKVHDADRPVLSDDMVLLLRSGKEIEWEPAIFAELASTGKWSEARFLERVRAHSFAFVITQGKHGSPLYDSRYTPGVDQAINEAYPILAQFADHTVHECLNIDAVAWADSCGGEQAPQTPSMGQVHSFSGLGTH